MNMPVLKLDEIQFFQTRETHMKRDVKRMISKLQKAIKALKAGCDVDFDSLMTESKLLLKLRLVKG